MGEIFYITAGTSDPNVPIVEKVMDRWFWVKQNVILNADGSFSIPFDIGWSGQPIVERGN